MSYANRLVAMSRGAITPAPSEHVREEHVEAPAATPAQAAAPARREPPLGEPAVRELRETHTVREETHTVERERELVRDRVRTVPVEREPAPARTHVIEQPVQMVERVVVPASEWLADDPGAPDPLVGEADSDALRDLMRSVRQWTSSEPTIVEAPKEAAPAAPAVPTAAEPMQISIGNVVVTVEDAPPAPRGASPQNATRPGAAGDRMARHHIRGGF